MIMGRISAQPGWKQIDRLFDAGSLVGLTDRQLLERFVAGEGSESAFEALVDRHGPMVRAVCRSTLGDAHEADDAFQATFLVLARKAASIRRGEAVGSWLYGVACRVAARARGEAARRRVLERFLAERIRPGSQAAEPSVEPMPEVLEEVERLPERYRAPIVLCYLEGRSHEQAATALGCPIRTVQTRLQRGKAKLRTRLVRRGLAPAVALAAIGVESAEAAGAGLGGTVPAALSESTARASVQFAASRAAGLASAAIGLAQGVLRSLFWSRLRRVAAGCGLCAGLALTLLAISALGQKPERPAATVAGKIVDERGRPIAGADVWLPTRSDDGADATPHATTDALGSYVLAVPEGWGRLPIHERGWVVWAVAPGHRFGMANAWEALSGKPQAVDLTLGPAADTSFVVLGPDGLPVAGAVVEPYRVLTPINLWTSPPAAVLRAIRGVTDAAGRVTLPSVAREGFRSAKVTSGPFGTQAVPLREGAVAPPRGGVTPAPTPPVRTTPPAAGMNPRPLRLRPTGRIEGRVVAARPEWTRGIKVSLSTTGPDDAARLDIDRGEGLAEVTADDEGRFVVPAIAEGALQVFPQIDPTWPVRPRPVVDAEVLGGQTTKCPVFLQKAVRIRGRIRVKGTGEPVAGASVVVSYGQEPGPDKGKGRLEGSMTVVSGADGQFEAYGLPGGVDLHLMAIPEPFVKIEGPTPRALRVREDAESFDFPPYELARGVTISGRLVDAEDRPVAGAEVFACVGTLIRAAGTTDAHGEFTTSRIALESKFSYKVDVPQGPPVVAMVVTEEPLLLKLPMGASGRQPRPDSGGVRGTVVDADGRPVAGAEVFLWIATPQFGKHEILVTDARGAYRSAGPVEQGANYRAIINPGAYALVSGEAVPATSSDPITLPPVKVARLRTIVGRVVDTAGRPVAGARVLNRGNDAPLVEAVTGSSGRLQIGGLPRGRAAIFVEAPGFRFHRESLDPGRTTFDVTIRREAQPPAGGVASLGPPIARDRALDLAAKVLKPYAERFLRSGTDPDARWRLLEVLARIDPEGAWRRCQAGEAPWDSDAVRFSVARHLARSRPDEAEAILPAIKNDYWRQTLRIELVDALPREQRERRLILLDEAGADALRTSDVELMVLHLSPTLRRLIDLGRGDAARRLLDEALPRCRAADAGNPLQPRIRGLIGCLARLDLEAALRLIPPAGDGQAGRELRGVIAKEIAADKPEDADRLIATAGGNPSETLIVSTCRRMAAADLPRARELTGRIQNHALRGYALGRMAEAIAAKDRSTARALRLDAYRALEQAVETGTDETWGARCAAVMAAALLPGVERDDPDRLAEAVDRVLSLRWFPRNVRDLTHTTPDFSGLHAMQTDAALAAILARYDHELARAMIRPTIERLRAGLPPFEDQHLDRYAILPVLALADPEAAAALMDVVPDDKEQGIGQSRDIARLIVAGALAAPEGDFWDMIRRAVMDLEMVDRED
jgi:RNA polymerase sigma factor (sigma-70 family)